MGRERELYFLSPSPIPYPLSPVFLLPFYFCLYKIVGPTRNEKPETILTTRGTRMPADAANQNALAQTESAGGVPVAKVAPTEQQPSQAGVPKKITNAQTVCNEKNAKGKLCNGHLKQMKTGGEEAEKHLRGDDVLFQCQTCGTLYMGPPLGHVRDPEKQSRFVEKELTSILRAAGGTLPAFKKSERGTLVPLEEDTSHHAPAASTAAKPATPAAAAKPATAASAKPASASAAPANETPEERKARLISEAQARKAATAGSASAKPSAPTAATPATAPPPPASTSGTDSSAEADRHRPAAEAQAATGQASAAPLSSAASTASPAAGAETVSDLAPEASTELTPGAPKDTRLASNTEAATEPEEPA
jgi:hypothetical protein